MLIPNIQYPMVRMRRNRSCAMVRSLVCETKLNAQDFVLPLFICEGTAKRQPIEKLPGIYRYNLDSIVGKVQEAIDAGICAIALFPETPVTLRNAQASEAVNPKNLICQALHILRKAFPDMIFICDVALDIYTDHGHDGLLIDNKIHNDQTNAILVEQALNQARAGCDTLAPSDMMDGRIGVIRKALDAAGFSHVRLLSYGVKYASQFYGPFRDAVGSDKVLKGDKKTYQMDPGNIREGLRETSLDISEGADIVMVKPAIGYLDVISALKANFPIPIFAYQVSGEYAMLAFGAQAGAFDFELAMMEQLTSIKRAGADAIFSYYALEAAKKLRC